MLKKKKTAKKAVKKTKKTPAKKTVKKTVKSPAKKVCKKPKATVPKKEEVVLKRNGTDKEGNAQFSAIKVYSRKPNGWKEARNVTGVPKGLKMIHNGKSAQSGERRTGFIKKK